MIVVVLGVVCVFITRSVVYLENIVIMRTHYEINIGMASMVVNNILMTKSDVSAGFQFFV